VIAGELSTDRAWTEADLTWERITLPPPNKVPVVRFDAAQAATIRAWPVDPDWELVVDERAPFVKIDDERGGGAPYFPRLGVCLDRRSGIVLGKEMSGSDAAFGHNALRAAESVFIPKARRPKQVFFVSSNLQIALGPWLKSIDVPSAACPMPDYLEELWSMLG
jgi:hypothetical protein